MARWLILLVTTLLWLGTMTFVYQRYGPKPPAPEALSNREAMEAVFSETAPLRNAWHIYVNLEQLTGPGRAPVLSGLNPERVAQRQHSAQQSNGKLLPPEEDGADPGEVYVGTMVNTLKHWGETRAEQHTIMRVQMPMGMAPTLQAIGDLSYESTAHLSMDQGVEDFSSTFSMGMGLMVTAKGFREKDELKITQIIYNGTKQMGLQQLKIPVNGASVPGLALSPFYARPSIRTGQHWEVAMLDTTSGSGEPRLVSVTAEVLGERTIRYHGREAHVYEVQAGSGKTASTAYYSPEGRVLKERWKIAELLNITLVREEDEPTP